MKIGEWYTFLTGCVVDGIYVCARIPACIEGSRNTGAIVENLNSYEDR